MKEEGGRERVREGEEEGTRRERRGGGERGEKRETERRGGEGDRENGRGNKWEVLCKEGPLERYGDGLAAIIVEEEGRCVCTRIDFGGELVLLVA